MKQKFFIIRRKKYKSTKIIYIKSGGFTALPYWPTNIKHRISQCVCVCVCVCVPNPKMVGSLYGTIVNKLSSVLCDWQSSYIWCHILVEWNHFAQTTS